MTAISVNLSTHYQYWYDKAIDYVFDFFEDPFENPSDRNTAQKGLLSRLLLDPNTMLMLLAYIAYLANRLWQSVVSNGLRGLATDVNSKTVCVDTFVSEDEISQVTVVIFNEKAQPIRDVPVQIQQLYANLKYFFRAYKLSFISGWAFLRIFRQLFSNHLVNYYKQWKKALAPFFLTGFRYYLQLLKPSTNTLSSRSSFC